MKKIIFLIIVMFSIFSKSNAEYSQLATSFEFNGIDGDIININDYKNKVILVVNVASRCGFTNQYKDLQELWVNYKDKGLVIIGVPTDNFKQEPGTNKDIKEFCETTFGIDFPMTEKTNVIGKNSHPFYAWAKKNHGRSAIPKWNFHKIIIGKDGKVADTFASITKHSSYKFTKKIDQELKN
jgi:glutathione peroxidase